MTDVADQIEKKLHEKLSPDYLQVINESDKHIGHAGHDGGGESHFAVVIRADVFKGQSRVACHRMIHDALDILLQQRIHALSIKILKD